MAVTHVYCQSGSSPPCKVEAPRGCLGELTTDDKAKAELRLPPDNDSILIPISSSSIYPHLKLYNHSNRRSIGLAGMQTSNRPRMPHSQPSQADMDLLSLLTSDSSSLGPLSGEPTHQKRQLPRRQNPVDALLISAVLAGSGPVTRHHLGHGVGEL